MAESEMATSPNFGWILLAQSLSAGGELFGQRAGRACHKHSNLRLLLSTVLYSAAQAFVILMVLELAFPQLTQGQGSIGMWKALWRHPGACFAPSHSALNSAAATPELP